MSLHIIILAAGAGKRMHSNVPKVLHKLAGKSLLQWVVDCAQQLSPDVLHIICGYEYQKVQSCLATQDNNCKKINWIYQEQQLGTGHAVSQAISYINDADYVLILSGDVPLINAQTLQLLVNTTIQQKNSSLLVANMPDASGLGRILRDVNNNVTAIIEDIDANNEQKKIQEIYTGICCIVKQDLINWLRQLTNNNAQNEYYLTDIIKIASSEKKIFNTIAVKDLYEVQGINNQLQLQQLERVWQQRQAESLLLAGVAIVDSKRFDVRGILYCGKDVFIDINCIFIGEVHIADGCKIHANCILTNVSIGAFSEILPNSVLENCTVGDYCDIGPFARIRPNTIIHNDCRIGNFVELKATVIAEHTKINHLSYCGDAVIGEHVNIGAGTIVCNFDGANKHQTYIGNHVFIGSGTQLIAPLLIEDEATIGAGSKIRKNVKKGSLTLTIGQEKIINQWKRPQKKLDNS